MRNDKDILLSVVVPVHNMAGRLQNLEESIAAGKNFPAEFFLVEDCSEDDTRDELEAIILRNDHARIELISGRFGSPGMARNAGLDRVQTPYVMFADSDDKFYLSSIDTALRAASNETQIIIGSYRQINVLNGGMKIHIPKEPLSKSLSLDPGIWRMVFKTAEIGKTKFRKYRMAEDQLWLAELEIMSKKIEISSSIFYEYYSQGPYSLTSSKSAKKDLGRVLIEYIKIINSNPKSVSSYVLMSFTKLWITALLNSRGSLKLIAMFLKQAVRTPIIFRYFAEVVCTLIRNNRGKNARN